MPTANILCRHAREKESMHHKTRFHSNFASLLPHRRHSHANAHSHGVSDAFCVKKVNKKKKRDNHQFRRGEEAITSLQFIDMVCTFRLQDFKFHREILYAAIRSSYQRGSTVTKVIVRTLSLINLWCMITCKVIFIFYFLVGFSRKEFSIPLLRS